MSDVDDPNYQRLDDADGYTGKALVTLDDHPTVALDVQLAGHFEPISGRYLWRGRVRGLTDTLGADAARPGSRLEIEIPGGHGTARVTAVDLWGSHMIDGESRRPFSAMEDAEGLLD